MAQCPDEQLADFYKKFVQKDALMANDREYIIAGLKENAQKLPWAMFVTDLTSLLYEKTKKEEEYLIGFKLLQALIFDREMFDDLFPKFISKCEQLKLILPEYLKEQCS